MRYESLALAGAVSAALALAVMPTGAKAPTRSVPAPCVRADVACERWVPLGHGARSMVYSTYPLDVRNPRVTRALIMVHGTLRNADHYFRTATGAAFIAGALGDTIVIAPAFHSAQGECKDRLAPHEVSWGCGGDSWRSGGAAASDPRLMSFDFMDTLLKTLADKRRFPNLKVIVVAGHSAGGQFVHRYEMANRVHETLGTPVRYVVANPSSYAWPDTTRPLPEGDSAPEAAAHAWDSESVHTNFRYGAFDAAKAPQYDRWPYGFEERKSGYTASESDDQLRHQLVSRPTTYLLSQVDVVPLGGFDGSPNAMAQGPTRRARGEAFVHYLNDHLGGHAEAVIVPECGHNDRCVYTTDEVLKVIFPDVR
jgi:hypothetical protein